MRYYIHHGAGLGDLVSEAPNTGLGNVQLVFRDDSSLVFETSSNADAVADLPYAKNVFEILGTVARGSVAGSTDQLVKHIRKRSLLLDQPRGRPFRAMAHIDGHLVALPRETRARLESVVSEQTGGLLTARGGAGVEYWIVGRRDLDIMLLCLRLTAGSSPPAERGSLTSDLSHLLVKASSPRDDDVFLDPFGGSGSIVAARIHTAFRSAIYSDIRLASLRPQLSRKLLRSQTIRILDEDARQLPSVPTGTVTSIVTDPPWGEHEDPGVPVERFAECMMKSFDRVLDSHSGRLVLLLSRRGEATVRPLWGPANLEIDTTHHILVNGHPATVLVGLRPGS